MGYYVRIDKSDVVIPAVHLDRVFKIFQFINRPEFDELKDGGSFGMTQERWYSWMNNQSVCTNAREVIEMLGFTTEETDAGIEIVDYDSKRGQEDLFLGVIGHLITGSIKWVGEDGSEWEDVYPSYNNKFHDMIRRIMEKTSLIQNDFPQ